MQMISTETKTGRACADDRWRWLWYITVLLGSARWLTIISFGRIVYDKYLTCLAPPHTWLTPQPCHKHHDDSVAVAFHSTLHTQETVFKQQPVSNANQSWPTTSYFLSLPFHIAAEVGSGVIFMEVYIPHWLTHGSVYIWDDFSVLMWVNLSGQFLIREFGVVCHFARSLHRLFALWFGCNSTAHRSK